MVKIWSKKTTQAVIKMLRDEGIEITRSNMGYESTTKQDGKPIFKAARGVDSYLVIHVDDLFVD